MDIRWLKRGWWNETLNNRTMNTNNSPTDADGLIILHRTLTSEQSTLIIDDRPSEIQHTSLTICCPLSLLIDDELLSCLDTCKENDVLTTVWYLVTATYYAQEPTLCNMNITKHIVPLQLMHSNISNFSRGEWQSFLNRMGEMLKSSLSLFTFMKILKRNHLALLASTEKS